MLNIKCVTGAKIRTGVTKSWWHISCTRVMVSPVDVSIKILHEFFYNKYLLRFLLRYTIYLKDIQVPAKNSCKINNIYFIKTCNLRKYLLQYMIIYAIYLTEKPATAKRIWNILYNIFMVYIAASRKHYSVFERSHELVCR